MWLNRSVYQDLQTALVTAQAEASAFKETNKGLQVAGDWFRMRITQLEKERAAFLNHYLDVKIPVPEITPAPDPFASHPFNDMSAMFSGMSEEDAQKAGIEHDAQGELVYKK